MEDSTGIYTNSYTPRHLLESSVPPSGLVTTNTYDAIGRRIQMRDGDGGTTTFQYDAVGRLAEMNRDGSRTTITYDAINRTMTKTLPNNAVASFSYDAASRQILLYNKNSNNNRISEFRFTYDDAGNQISVRQQVRTQFPVRVTWIYDSSFQLIQEHRSGVSGYQTTFTYDNNGNRLVKKVNGTMTTSTFDAGDQLINSVDSTGVTTYSFDANGNQSLSVSPVGGRTTNSWGYENQVELVELPSGDRVTAIYNADNRRVEELS